MSFALALVAAFAASGLAAALGRRARLVDDPSSAPERKPQRGPVPRVGGIVLACFALLAWFTEPAFFRGWAEAPARGWLGGALLLAFLVGLADDLWPGGLRPGAKLAAQLLVAGSFVHSGVLGEPAGPLGNLAWILFTLAALSAANTFDNADGALTGLGLLALVPQATLIPAALAGFLPWNLCLRLDSTRPRAYLGDSGSHLLGLLLVCRPESAWILLLPALDLARLAWLRLRSGSRPWIGDRRHLAHRLAARGLGPTATLAALLAIAAPAALVAPAWGAALTCASFVLALRLAPDPCRGRGSPG